MDTPIVSFVEKDFETVYEPSEDSFLLIDALEKDLDMLKTARPTTCIEIGSGSGVVITALAMAFNKCQKCHFIAIDINPDACRVTKRTSINNSVDVDVIQTDLLSCVHAKQLFDIILFNPPYVVTEPTEVFDKRLLFKTWAGGENGRQVMERTFSKIPKILSDRGLFYLVVIKENDPEYILRIFQNLNMSGEIVARRKVRGEQLYILRFRKVKSKTVF